MPKDYSSERGIPDRLQCDRPKGVHTLLFDGYYLKLLLASRVVQAWHARSGSSGSRGTFDLTPAKQRTKGAGPIPEGEWWVVPDELAFKPTLLEIWRDDDWNEMSWGHSRLTIHARPSTKTFGRGGFFIHGGIRWGSAGCIDLTYGMRSFVKTIRSFRNCHLPLSVNYNGVESVPLPQ